MKRRMKQLATLAVLGCIAVVGYQVWSYVSHYNTVKETLYRLMVDYDRMGEERFRTELLHELKMLDVVLDPGDIKIQEDKPRGTIRVEFRYTREINLLFTTMKREVHVWRSLRDVDVSH